jgi:hypothetical protein
LEKEIMVQRPFKLALGYAILGFAALGCGSSDSSSDKTPALSEPPRVTASAASLNLISTTSDTRLTGVWKSKCVANPDGGSSSMTLEITDNNLQQTMSLFRFSNCYGHAMDARFITAYAAQNGQLTTTLKQTHLTLEAPFAQAARSGSSCGFNGWQAGVWYDLTDKVCVQSRDGVWVSPTQAGTKNTTAFDITVANGEAKMDVGGVIVSRPTRNGDEPNIMPQPTPTVTPVSGFLFSERSNQDVETFLKKWGCVESLEQGVSQCPAPKTLIEASQLIDKLIAFGHAVYGDANFKDKPALQAQLNRGYYAELNKAKAFPAYADVQKSLTDGLARLHTEYPQYQFLDFVNVNALKAMQSLNTLREALDILDLESELVRLNVTHIYTADSRQYAKGEGKVYVIWDDNSTAEEMLNYLKSQIPVTLSPGVASLKQALAHGLGFQAEVH